MPGKADWLEFAEERLGPLDPLERALAEAAADVLATGGGHMPDMSKMHQWDKDSAASLVAIVELARAVASGDPKYVVVTA